MYAPLLVWLSIAILALLIVSVRIIGELDRRPSVRHHTKIIDLGHEWEEFYVPGDKTLKDLNDYNDNDD